MYILKINSLLVDGFPLILCVFCWLLMGLGICWLYYLFQKKKQKHMIIFGKKANSIRHNIVYKRAGYVLLALGFIGGFLPSVLILFFTGEVFSVNEQGPHPMVDTTLFVHIPLAILFALLAGFQLWSGDKKRQKKTHRLIGWIAFGAVAVGISMSGGWIWPILNDFSNGLDSPTAGAGVYTILNGLAIAINASLMVFYAKKGKLAKHKDHALMTLFWTMDPGIHRLFMWLMRLLCWECWAPENTGDMGIALAKLPANVSLIIWALVMAYYAGRLNKIILINASGQFFLWLLGTMAVIEIYMGNTLANWISVVSVSLWIILIFMIAFYFIIPRKKLP